MKNTVPVLSLLALGLSLFGFLSCRTAQPPSTVKEAAPGEMSKEEFVAACTQRISDPESGSVYGFMVRGLAGAKDCDDAYEKVKAIVALP